MKREPPATNGGRGAERLTGNSFAPFNTATFRAQMIASRFALPLETAAIVAALAFAGGSQ